MNWNPSNRPTLLLSCAAALLLSLSAIGGERGGYTETAKERAAAAGQKAGEAVDDIRLHAMLEAELARNEQLSALMINTDVRDGIAYFEGEVENETQRDLATQLALSVEGIQSVQNDLEATGGKPSLAKRVIDGASDAAVTAAVKSRLLVSRHTSGLDIKVEADDNVVTLSGEVDSDDERELAELIAANTLGVIDVNNQLRVNNW